MPVVSNPVSVALPNGKSLYGNMALRVEYDLQGGENALIDVGGGGISASLDRIESIYVDNSRASVPLYLFFPDTSRALVVPAGAEGCYPTFSRSTSFVIFNNDTTKAIRARMILFACHKEYFERYAGSSLGGSIFKSDYFNTPGAPSVYAPGVPLYKGATWDTALARPGVTFTALNKRVEFSTSALPALVNHTTHRKAGKWYVELRMTLGGGWANGNPMIGFCNTAYTTGSEPRPDNALVLLDAITGALALGPNANQYSVGGSPVNNCACFAINLDSKRIYARLNSGAWAQGADPVGDTGGFDISTIIGGGIAPAFWCASGNPNTACTGNFSGVDGLGGVAFEQAIPAGFLPWNGAAL